MTEHITEPQMKRFGVSALGETELVVIGEHLSDCDTCQNLLSEILKSQRGTEAVRFTLAPEFWLRHEHVDYEQLVEIAGNKLDDTDRQILNVHLNICATCREAVRSFMTFQKEIEPELHVHYGPDSNNTTRLREPALWRWWQSLTWKPAYATAALVILGIAVILAVTLVRRRAANVETTKTPQPTNNSVARQTPTPDTRKANDPAPLPPTPPNQPQKTNSDSTVTVNRRAPTSNSASRHAIVALNDGRGTVTVDAAGAVSGLDNLSPATRRETADALVAEKLETPRIVAALSGPDRTLRGPSRGTAFKLLSPARTVIINDRPSFRWDKLAGATGYRVYVGDLKGHEIAKSKELAPDQTTWKSPIPLERGEIYSWAVGAIVDGKEILSPGASAAEMKFQILSSKDLNQLHQLEKTDSHLALGVFYTRVGMISEAKREFQRLLRLNPRSRVVLNLVRAVRSLDAND